jgi:glycerophosphoryl diester phosphodiesterase
MMLMGHRGAAALEPENTLRAIHRAMEEGVQAVEIDVRLTRDQEVVVIHDATVDRTTNGKGPVSSYTLEEIKRLDAGRGEQVPTLQEVIDLVRDRINLVVELKAMGTEWKVADLIRRNELYGRSYVISFWHRLVKMIREVDSRIKTGVLLVGCPVDASMAIRAGAEVMVMHYGFVDGEFVEEAHRQGFKVFVWNIDDPDLIKPYVDMRVDAIGSNDPGLLVDYFRREVAPD